MHQFTTWTGTTVPLMNDNIDIIPEPELEPDKQHHPSQSIHGFIILFSLS